MMIVQHDSVGQQQAKKAQLMHMRLVPARTQVHAQGHSCRQTRVLLFKQPLRDRCLDLAALAL